MVIAIIAILAALLLPSLSTAKARAYSVKCASNPRQITLSFKLAVDDDSGRLDRGYPISPEDFPFGRLEGGHESWCFRSERDIRSPALTPLLADGIAFWFWPTASDSPAANLETGEAQNGYAPSMNVLTVPRHGSRAFEYAELFSRDPGGGGVHYSGRRVVRFPERYERDAIDQRGSGTAGMVAAVAGQASAAPGI